MPLQRNNWRCCCASLRQNSYLLSQVLIAYIVIIVSLVNLTLFDVNICLWSSLASGTIGYLLPNPNIRYHHEPLLSDTAVYASMKIYPDNTVAKYTTQLATNIELDGEWEVALTEIQYSHNFHNIKGECSGYSTNTNGDQKYT